MRSSRLYKPLSLAGFTCLCMLLVFVTALITRQAIEHSRQQSLLERLNVILADLEYDNELHSDQILMTHSLLGSEDAQSIWRARYRNRPVAAIISSVAPDGYGGPIKLLVGVRWNGELSAVRVVEHAETPGLGDDIEITRSDWINGFSEKSLNNPETLFWRVKKDGGVFDQFTGATITPRTIVSAIHSTLTFFEANREAIFAKPADPHQ